VVSVKGYIKYILFESGSDDIEDISKLMACLEDLLKIVSGLENERSMTLPRQKHTRMRTRQEQKHLKMLPLKI
jgi:hypothetical protein